MKKISCALASAAVLLASASLASAQAIAVGNASFQTPSVTASPFYSVFPTDAANVFGAWEQFGNQFKAVYQTANYGGTLTNGDGTQAATLGAATGAGGIIQDLTNYTTPTTSQTFQLGQTYTLTVGVGRRADSLPAIGSQLTLRLYYRTADQGAAVILASQPLTVGAAAGPNVITGAGVLTDYTISYTVPAGSTAIGKPIGVWFDITTPGTVSTTGDFAVDNVRLVASVPEPTSVAMLALGVFGLGGYALRRRQV